MLIAMAFPFLAIGNQHTVHYGLVSLAMGRFGLPLEPIYQILIHSQCQQFFTLLMNDTGGFPKVARQGVIKAAIVQCIGFLKI
jgi:hypothetical protein